MTNRMFRYRDETGKDACVRLSSIIGFSCWWPPELKVPEGTVATIHLETVSGSTSFATSETVEELRESYDALMRRAADEDRRSCMALWRSPELMKETLDAPAHTETPK